MKWRTTPGSWSRRDKVLASVLAVVAAVGAAARALGWEETVSTAALAIAVAGAIVRLLIAVVEARLNRGREQEKFARRLRVPIAPVKDIPCTRIGVDPAAAEILPGGKEPQYVLRTIDGELNDALVRALDGTGSPDGGDSWFVVVCGPSKVGKSRTLFEALRKLCEEGRDLRLIAPTDGKALRSLLPGDLKPRSKRQHPVLWLDDLETFVAKKVGIETLRDWHEKAGAIVVGTFGGKGSDLVRPDRAKQVTSLADSLLLHAEKVGLEITSSEELEGLPVELSAGEREIVERYGLAAALVGADLLQQRLMVERQGVTEPASPVGKAIVRAAADWTRCGRVDPISKAQLGRLWPAYLKPPGASAGEGAFEAGLEWALHPVAGQISPLIERDGYSAYDYAVLLGGRGDDSPPKDEAWDCALDTDDPEQILAVGVTASNYGLGERATAAMEAAGDAGDKKVAATALFNLGVLADKRKDLEAAADAWRKAMDLGNGDAAFNLALLMEELGDPAASIAAYERAAELKHEAGTLNLASVLEKNGETDKAIAVLRTGMENGSGKCASNLGLILKDKGLTEQAQEAFRKSIELGDGVGARNLAAEKLDEGNENEAFKILQQGMELGDGFCADEVGTRYWEKNKLKKAEAAYRRSAELGFGPGANHLGRLLLNQNRDKEATEAFHRAMELDDAEGAFAFGKIRFEARNMKAAMEAFRKAKELGFPPAMVAVGIRQAELGEFAEARESLQMALDSDDPKAAADARAALEQIDERERSEGDQQQEV